MADCRKEPGAVIPRRPAPPAYRGLVCKARSALAPAGQRPPLSPFALLRQFVNLAFDRFEVERGGLLHRRKIDRRLRQREDFLLHLDEAPELTGKKAVHVALGRVVPGLTSQRGRPLERILSEVDDTWHVRSGLFVRPSERLLEELEFEGIDPDCAEVRSAEVPDLVALRRPFAKQQVKLIVAVQVVLVSPIPKPHTLQ